MARKSEKPTWAVVSTMKEDERAVKNFVAHYKAMGADEIRIYFDDPDDSSISFLKSVEGVHAVLCDDKHWRGKRPSRHERRQKHNAILGYRATRCDWVVHLDADEFIYCPEGVANLLDGLKQDQPAARIVPAEPLLRPKSEEIKAYRSPLPATDQGLRVGIAAFGEVYRLMAYGMLSHAAGKYFLRTGIEGAPITIHRPQLPRSADIPNLATDDILLLHHHGCSEDEWVEKFKLRLETTYSARFWDDSPKSGKVDGLGLNGYLKREFEAKGEEGLRAFFRQVYHIDNRKAILRRVDAIHRPQLWLKEKRDALFGRGKAMVSNFHVNDESGKLEAEIRFMGIMMILQPDFNYSDHVLALGHIEEEAELSRVRSLVKDKSVNFWDVGAHTGIYSLVVAAAAKADSAVQAFEPHPQMIAALKRNIAAGKFKNISVEPVALGKRKGKGELAVPADVGLGALRGEGEALSVNVGRLMEYVEKSKPKALSILKVDVAGGEDLVLEGFFKGVPKKSYPDYILYDHTRVDAWEIHPDTLFPADHYEVDQVFERNTLLKAKTA